MQTFSKTAIRRFLLSVVLGGAPLSLCGSASAEEHARLGLGVAVSAFSTQVQGDAEFGRQVGVQAGIGLPLYGSLSLSGGGRFYFTRSPVTPYVGVLVAFQNEERDGWYNHHYYRAGGHATLLGPTIGLRIRQRHVPGLGAFVQLEVMEETHDPGYVYPSLGAGVQWWF